jgi:hypothetical protein
MSCRPVPVQLSSSLTKPWTKAGNLVAEKAPGKFKYTTDFVLVYCFLTRFRRSELDSWNDASRKNSVAQALVMSGHRLRERERCKGRFSLTSNRSGKKSSRLALGMFQFDHFVSKFQRICFILGVIHQPSVGFARNDAIRPDKEEDLRRTVKRFWINKLR